MPEEGAFIPVKCLHVLSPWADTLFGDFAKRGKRYGSGNLIYRNRGVSVRGLKIPGKRIYEGSKLHGAHGSARDGL